MPKIDLENKKGELIKSAKYSVVYNYEDINNSEKKWALKKITAGDSNHLLKAIQSVNSLNLDHSSIVPVQAYKTEAVESEGFHLYFLMSKMKESLSDVINQKKLALELKLELEEIVRIFYSLVTGLEFLHQKEIAHGNIKSTNILFDDDNKARLSDIGSVPYYAEKDDLESRESEFLYQAPEAIEAFQEKIEYDVFKADIWSLGIVLAELVLLKNDLIKPSLSKEQKEEDVQKLLAEVKEQKYEELTSLVENLLSIRGEDRPTLEQIKSILEMNYKEIIFANTENKAQDKGVNLKIPIKQDHFGAEVPKEENASPSKVTESIVLQSWDLFANTMQKNYGKAFKLQLSEPLHIKLNGVEVNDDQLCTFLLAFDNTLSTYQIFNIKLLDITLPGEGLTDHGIQMLGLNINGSLYLKELQYLSLNLAKNPFAGNFGITNDGIKTLMEGIGKNLKTLKFLSLSFSEYNTLTEKGIEYIAQNIGPNLTQLVELKLDFSWCLEFTNKAMKSLMNSLNKLKNLASLTLDFRRCWKISDDGLDDLRKGISYFEKLQHLELYFYACSQITDKGVANLGSQINNLKEIRRLVLNLYSCDKVTENAKDVLRQKLSFILKTEII